APFIAPPIKKRCSKRKMVMIGIIEMIAPAAIKRQSDVKVPDNMFSPSGNVYISLSFTIINGHKKSPHADTKVKMVKVTIAGFTNGIKTRSQIWKLFAPSILADSSNDFGTVMNA